MSEVRNWLERIGLGQYAEAFETNEIDMDLLGEVDDQMLKDIGISTGGHRLRIRKAITKLGAAPVAVANVGSTMSTQSELPVTAAERRQLTVMFCDLVGSTALSARLDPEDMREVIRAYQDACSGPIARYEGFLAKFMGDGILAYFGFPQAHEDDSERAVRAGLDIITAVNGFTPRPGVRLQVRIGVATGLVVVGDLIGSGTAQEQAVVGETPNIAARLQTMAEPGTIVVAASTRRLLGGVFKLRELGQHEVKGVIGPVEAWAIEGVASSESRFEAFRAARLTGFVGRKEEVALLLDRKNLAWQGEGQIVLITGEAGIGKSRVAAALGECLAAEPHVRLRYQCSPYHVNSALHPFSTQIERAAGIKPDDPPERRLDKLEAVLSMGTAKLSAAVPLFAAMLSVPTGDRYPPLTLSPAQQRRQTLAALLDQLEGLARRQPVLFLFEDAHWADATSLELLDLTVERLRQLPVLAIITCRPEFEPSWAGLQNVTSLVLGRLDQPHVQLMVQQVTGGRILPEQVLAQIIHKTDGIPLFVEELTKAVLEGGILVEEAEGYRLNGPLTPLAIPATLQDSLMARLDRLAPVKEVAQVGAAIGREFSYALLRTVTGRDEDSLASTLDQLEASELVFRRGQVPETVYIFKHALVQDAAYESLLKSRRQVLHRRIAECLRDRFPTIAEAEPETVAHHFTQAGLSELAAEWWGKAGEHAIQSSACNEAIAHLRKAIDLSHHLATGRSQGLIQLKLYIAYGNALISARGYTAPETIAAFTRARELAADIPEAPERFSAYYGLWAVRSVRAEPTLMREVAEAFLVDAQRLHGSQEICVANRLLGCSYWAAGDYIAGRRHLEEAVAGYDPARDRALAFRFGQDLGVAAKVWLSMVLGPLGHIGRAKQLLQEAVAEAEQCRHAQTMCFAHAVSCLFAATNREPDRAMPHAAGLVTLGREHDMLFWMALGTFFLGWAHLAEGDSGGEREMREGLARLHRIDVHLYDQIAQTLVAEQDAKANRIDSALDILESQLGDNEKTGQRWLDSDMHRARAEVLLQSKPSDARAAEGALMRALEIARSQQTRAFELRASLKLAKLYNASGRNEAARKLLVPAIIGLSGSDVPEVVEANSLLKSLDKANDSLLSWTR